MVIVDDGDRGRVVEQGRANRVAQDDGEGFIGFDQQVTHDVFCDDNADVACQDGDRAGDRAIVVVGRAVRRTGHHGVGQRNVAARGVVQEDLEGNGAVIAAGAFHHAHPRHRTFADSAPRGNLDGSTLHGHALYQIDHLHANTECWRNLWRREEHLGCHRNDLLRCREAKFVSQRIHALAHAQQAHKAGVALATGTAAQTRRRGVQLGVQVAAALQRLDDGVGRGWAERAVGRCWALCVFSDASVQLDGLLGRHGDGLAIEHLQLNMPASGGLDDFVFFQNVARFDLAGFAV